MTPSYRRRAGSLALVAGLAAGLTADGTAVAYLSEVTNLAGGNATPKVFRPRCIDASTGA